LYKFPGLNKVVVGIFGNWVRQPWRFNLMLLTYKAAVETIAFINDEAGKMGNCRVRPNPELAHAKRFS
jgi:hypothetical protein